MRIGGVEITGELSDPNQEVLVLPRSKSQIIFTAQALPDMTDFERRVPVPGTKKNFHKGKGWIDDLEDPVYLTAMEDYTKLRVAYFIVFSLQDMDWDEVDKDKPATWNKWEDEFKENGFSQHECNLILQLCFQVNQLDETKLEQARSLFVLGQEQEAKDSSSRNSEQGNLQSGGRAKGSE